MLKHSLCCKKRLSVKTTGEKSFTSKLSPVNCLPFRGSHGPVQGLLLLQTCSSHCKQGSSYCKQGSSYCKLGYSYCKHGSSYCKMGSSYCKRLQQEEPFSPLGIYIFFLTDYSSFIISTIICQTRVVFFFTFWAHEVHDSFVLLFLL